MYSETSWNETPLLPDWRCAGSLVSNWPGAMLYSKNSQNTNATIPQLAAQGRGVRRDWGGQNFGGGGSFCTPELRPWLKNENLYKAHIPTSTSFLVIYKANLHKGMMHSAGPGQKFWRPKQSLSLGAPRNCEGLSGGGRGPRNPIHLPSRLTCQAPLPVTHCHCQPGCRPIGCTSPLPTCP